MPGSSVIAGAVPDGANSAKSTVRQPRGNRSSSRFSTGMRYSASSISKMTAAAIRLDALKKSRCRPLGDSS